MDKRELLIESPLPIVPDDDEEEKGEDKDAE